jgi:hypothetical protein
MFLLSDISNRDPLNKSEGLTPLKRERVKKKDFSVEGKKKVITKERRRRRKKIYIRVDILPN